MNDDEDILYTIMGWCMLIYGELRGGVIGALLGVLGSAIIFLTLVMRLSGRWGKW